MDEQATEGSQVLPCSSKKLRATAMLGVPPWRSSTILSSEKGLLFWHKGDGWWFVLLRVHSAFLSIFRRMWCGTVPHTSCHGQASQSEEAHVSPEAVSQEADDDAELSTPLLTSPRAARSPPRRESVRGWVLRLRGVCAMLLAALTVQLVATRYYHHGANFNKEEVEQGTTTTSQKKLCFCSPRTFTFQLDLSLTCPPTNITTGRGVNEVVCSVRAVPKKGKDVTDLTAVSVHLVQILELGSRGRVIRHYNEAMDLLQGGTFNYTSVTATSDDIIPRGMQVILWGINSEGDELINKWILTYTNDCGVEPVFERGASAGWAVFANFDPPRADQCAGSAPTVSPSTTGAPSASPTFQAPSISPTSPSPNSGFLMTTFDGNILHHGNMFNIVPLKNISILGMMIHSRAGGLVKVYTKKGPFQGFERNGTAWSQIASWQFEGMGKGNPISIPEAAFHPVALRAGHNQAFYVTLTLPDLLSSNTVVNVGDVYASNSDVQLLVGVGLDYPFGHRAPCPLVWNGAIRYALLSP